MGSHTPDETIVTTDSNNCSNCNINNSCSNNSNSCNNNNNNTDTSRDVKSQRDGKNGILPAGNEPGRPLGITRKAHGDWMGSILALEICAGTRRSLTVTAIGTVS